MEKSKFSILFVCAGNICRSPMAKVLASHFFGDKVHVESAGVTALVGRGATADAIKVMAEAGLDLKDHCASGLETLEFSHWNIVVALTPRIARMITESGQVTADHFVTWNVADPYCLEVEAYRRCAERLSELLPTLADLIEPDPTD